MTFRKCTTDETNIGMLYYISDAEGTGGRLKASAEDFVVTEISSHPEPSDTGKYTIATVTAKNWETNRMVRMMARQMDISRERIGFAGTKDKRAVTTQLMSFECDPSLLEKVNLQDLSIGETYRAEFEMMRSWIISLGGRFIEQTPKGLTNVGKFVYKDADCTNEQLQSELGSICKIVTMSYPDSSAGGEIMLPDVNKSVGIQKVLEYYGADVTDTIAIGDGGNDIEMLDFCKLSVVMGNAPDIVKHHADIVTDRIDNDGLYKAFETLGLI